MAFIKVPIEVDITCVNKTWFTLKKSNKKVEPQNVIGIFQREGSAIIHALKDSRAETITEAVLQFVAKGCTLYVEHNVIPIDLAEFYTIVELKDGRHANGDVHVNNVKNLWKDLKRTIRQTHLHVSNKHLQLYCDEVMWRANHRHLSPSEQFEAILSNITIPREKAKYKNLIK